MKKNKFLNTLKLTALAAIASMYIGGCGPVEDSIEEECTMECHPFDIFSVPNQQDPSNYEDYQAFENGVPIYMDVINENFGVSAEFYQDDNSSDRILKITFALFGETSAGTPDSITTDVSSVEYQFEEPLNICGCSGFDFYVKDNESFYDASGKQSITIKSIDEYGENFFSLDIPDEVYENAGEFVRVRVPFEDLTNPYDTAGIDKFNPARVKSFYLETKGGAEGSIEYLVSTY
jgi:hypothetical protein